MVIAPSFGQESLDPALLQLPLSVLNLTVRATHCLSDVPTIADLLDCTEAHLMRRRNFGRTSLVDVRRKLVHYFVDRAAHPAERRIREALYDPHPAIEALWRTPAQARPLREVVADLLDLLSRPDELRRAEPWSYSTQSLGPPRSVDFDAASLEEVVDALFGCLKERERRVLERRFGPLDGEGATLAEVGREFGLTRERVRQIVQACIARLGADGEMRRREPLLECIRRGLEEAGGVLHERDLADLLRRRFAPPHPDLGPALRLFMQLDPHFQPAGQRLWALGDVPAARIRAIQEAFHARLRAAARPVPEAALLEELLRDSQGDLSPAFLAGCLHTDPRICRTEGNLYGLVEWQPLRSPHC